MQHAQLIMGVSWYRAEGALAVESRPRRTDFGVIVLVPPPVNLDRRAQNSEAPPWCECWHPTQTREMLDRLARFLLVSPDCCPSIRNDMPACRIATSSNVFSIDSNLSSDGAGNQVPSAQHT